MNPLFLKSMLMKKNYKAHCSEVMFCPSISNIPFFQILLVAGGQAPKAIRSVECYDFKEERWYQLAELPTRRCRAGLAVLNGLVYAVGGFNGSLRVRTVDVYDPVRDQV